MPAPPTRAQIIDAADRLFHGQGFEHTSFAHIAEAVGISRGNFYHHFKAKDDILEAVIAMRAARTEAMLGQWEAQDTQPQARLRAFVRLLLDNQASIMESGCPVGSLCSELARLGHPSQPGARGLFTLFRGWLRQQFTQAGCGAEADALAMHLLARSQGAAVLMQAFRDPAFAQAEVARMEQWLAAVLPAPAPAAL
ncbi:MAG: helix-turn-helix domain-containing protein [Xenophilus sp.]